MKISVLAENSVGRSHNRDCLAEWGLSLFLDLGDRRILFDSGHKGTFLQNATAIGIDVDTSDYVVLSHHHWDHTGGLRFWEPSAKKPLVAHPQVIEKIPADQSKNLLEKFDVATTTTPLEFAPGVIFLGQVPRIANFEQGTYLDDPMLDDTAIAIKTDKGAIVVTGCSHAGVCNISQYAKDVTGQPLRGVIGGFHLLGATDALIDATVAYFKNEQIEFLYPMHCVDYVAMSEFYRNFGVKKYAAGDVFEVEY